jgi:hypothetical protein
MAVHITSFLAPPGQGLGEGTILLTLVMIFILEISIIYMYLSGFAPDDYRCKPLYNSSSVFSHMGRLPVNHTIVEYERCHIRVFYNSSDMVEEIIYPCINGYDYSVPRDRSIVTEVRYTLAVIYNTFCVDVLCVWVVWRSCYVYTGPGCCTSRQGYVKVYSNRRPC